MRSPTIDLLLILQDRDTRRLGIEAQLKGAPREVAAVEQRIASEKAAIEAAKTELREYESKKKILEMPSRSKASNASPEVALKEIPPSGLKCLLKRISSTEAPGVLMHCRAQSEPPSEAPRCWVAAAGGEQTFPKTARPGGAPR